MLVRENSLASLMTANKALAERINDAGTGSCDIK